MDIIALLDDIESLAENYHKGLLTLDDVKFFALLSITDYTNTHFTYGNFTYNGER